MSVVKDSQYTCVTCLQYFATRDLLIRHLFNHDIPVNTPLHICQTCGQVFLNLAKLCAHNFEERVIFNELCCAVCQDTFSSRCSLKNHVFTHISVISAPLCFCIYSSTVFKDLAKLQFHKYVSRTSQRRDYCDCKSSIYTYKQQLTTSGHQNNSKEEEPLTTYSGSDSSNYKQSCKLGQSDELSTSYKLHKISFIRSSSPTNHHSDYVSYKKISTQSESLQVQKTFYFSEYSASLKFCEKAPEQAAHRDNLQKIHSVERPFSCDVCGKSFKHSQHLKVHQRIHSGTRPFSCYVCGKSFTQSGRLKSHQMIHSGDRPFFCNTCGKSFTQSEDLKRHQRIHSGERPYSCHVCGATFTAIGNLKTHWRIHSGERPYSCELCGKSFSLLGTLKTHVGTHSGERPFSCEACGKCFTRSANLKLHKRIHSGERPFSCEICGRTYTQSVHLKRHQKSHLI